MPLLEEATTTPLPSFTDSVLSANAHTLAPSLPAPSERC